MPEELKLFEGKKAEELTWPEILLKATFMCLSFLTKVEEFEKRLLAAEKAAKK